MQIGERLYRNQKLILCRDFDVLIIGRFSLMIMLYTDLAITENSVFCERFSLL